MKIIKNQTPYIGKLRLKFERYPHYTRGGDTDLLNKIHLNLGFTKLVSRMFPFQTLRGGDSIDPKKVELINKHTGGVITDYIFNNGQHQLKNSFMDLKKEVYIGDIRRAWWYYKNNMVVDDKHPLGVAHKLNKNLKDRLLCTPQDVEGIYGYSHRGGQLFKIGDKIFESFWTPNEQDLFDLQKYYVKHLDKYDKDYANHMSMNEWATRYIPFKLRGSRVIKDWDDAKEAAINFSKYIG